jgi:ParB family chromosome partitioning protein
MTVKKRGLGRGLDALLGSGGSIAHTTGSSEDVLRQLPVEMITRGRYQPRIDIRQESLQELADSIRVQGIVQPILVRSITADRYEIIAGERRWRAAQLAGLSDVPAIIRDVPDEAAIAIALIENIQREDLNPLEEAFALKRLGDEFDLTHQQIAEAVGRSRSAVTNLLRLLELDSEVQPLLRDGKLEMGHARALLPLPATLQREAAQQICLRGLSVRETEELVRRLQQQPVKSAAAQSETQDPDIRLLQEDLSERLGAKVSIQHNTSGKGRLVIQYNSLDELDGILNHVK